MLRLVITGALVVLLIFVVYQVYKLHRQEQALAGELGTLTDQLASMSAENDRLRGDLTYYERPENLEKELRARFNYALPGEKMAIIVSPH